MTKKPTQPDLKKTGGQISKYDIVKYSSIYFNLLKQNPELSKLSVSQLIQKSVTDIQKGEITPEEILEQLNSKKQSDLSNTETSREKETTDKETEKKTEQKGKKSKK